jgi:tyrosyl-tRNA synthetase
MASNVVKGATLATWQAETMAQFIEDLRFRGLIHQMTDPELEKHLDTGQVTAYSGFDPTADSLHVGHLLQVCNLRRLQLAGHRPIAVAGGGTGFVGDPGGKAEERSLLSNEELRSNLSGIHGQLERFLDFGGDNAETGALLLNNADWLASLRLFDFLRDVGKHFTVNQMVAKDSVKSRLSRADQGISYTEFSYMLLQALDFLHLFDAHGCRLQMGGSDQWGNITMGIDLVRRVRHEEVWGLTTPLVLKADGTKFGKTESGTVWLDAGRTSPYQLYQFFLRSEDAVAGAYLRYFTFLPRDAIVDLDEAIANHPERRDAQRELARQVCSLVHGESETVRAEQASAALFGEEVAQLDEQSLLDVFAEAPSTILPRSRLDGPGLAIVDLLVETGLARSKGQARTTVEQGGAYVNNRRSSDVAQTVGADDLVAGRYLVLRRGKKDYHLVRFV